MKDKIERTKQFIERHKVGIACTTGAAVGVLVTRKIDTQLASAFIYKVGAQSGVMTVHLDMALTFIEEKDLWDEYLNYGPKFVEISAKRAGARLTEATESLNGAL